MTYCVTSQRSWWLTIHPRESIACPLVPILSRVSWAWATWRVSRHVTWCVLVTVSQLSVSLHFTSEGCIHTNQPGRTYHWQYLLSLLSRPVITRASLEVMCRNICKAQHRTVTILSLDTCWGKPWCQWLLRNVVTNIPSSTSQSFLSLSLASLLSPLVCSAITVNAFFSSLSL